MLSGSPLGTINSMPIPYDLGDITVSFYFVCCLITRFIESFLFPLNRSHVSLTWFRLTSQPCDFELLARLKNTSTSLIGQIFHESSLSFHNSPLCKGYPLQSWRPYLIFRYGILYSTVLRVKKSYKGNSYLAIIIELYLIKLIFHHTSKAIAMCRCVFCCLLDVPHARQHRNQTSMQIRDNDVALLDCDGLP